MYSALLVFNMLCKVSFWGWGGGVGCYVNTARAFSISVQMKVKNYSELLAEYLLKGKSFL